MTAAIGNIDTTFTAATVASRSASSPARLEAVDTARLAAAVGVIWIHACQSPATEGLAVLGRFAVPFFSAAAAFFLVRTLIRQPSVPTSGCPFSSGRFPGFFASRARRLYLPFLAWSLVYLAVRTVNQISAPSGSFEIPGWNVLLVGGAYHLWFIPFLLVASCGIYAGVRLAGRLAVGQHTLAYASLVVGGMLAISLQAAEWPGSEFGYALQALPGLLWGCALAWALSGSPSPHSRDGGLCVTAVASFVACQFLLFYVTRDVILESTAGVSLLVAGLYAPRFSRLRGLAVLGQVSLGIFFAHLLFLKFGEAAFERWDVTLGVSGTLLLIAATTVAAAALSLVLARYRRTRWLVM